MRDLSTITAVTAALIGAALLTAQTTTTGEVTYARDVAPILYKHCTGCHHPNDIAPMSLMTYESARPWARAIKQAVVTRVMPPWQADSKPGQFTNDPRLNESEIDTLRKWVDNGAKPGNLAEVPPAPAYSEAWKIGKPDAVVPIQADYVVKPGSVDRYVYLNAPTNFTEDRWVTAVELRPGNRRVVHHAHVYVFQEKKTGAAAQAQEEARKDKLANGKPQMERIVSSADGLHHINPAMPVLDDGCSSPEGGDWPGNSKDSKGDSENTILGSYLPGKSADVFPEGYARLVPKGATLQFQIHYNSGSITKEELDRTSVGFIFAKEPPKQALRRLDIHNYLFSIPPNDSNHGVTACYVFDRDIELTSYTAHMHLRGKAMRFEAVHPDGRRELLVDVPHYDFNWQTEYELRERVPLERGTKVLITAAFDNSVNNRYNPDPSKTIRWGEPSQEEMMDGWLEYVLPERTTSSLRGQF